MTDNWKPNKELLEWAKAHTKEMSVGGMWMPEGSGLTYIKVDDNTWKLNSMIDNEEAKDNHSRMKVLMFDVGVKVLDDETEILPMPENANDAHRQELIMKQRIAQSWADKDGTRLLDMNLENSWPEYVEDKEILLDNGETKTVEIWVYKTTNPNTGETVSIDPDDYHLLMGDQYFMRFVVPATISGINTGEAVRVQFRALSRQEIVEYIDAGNEGVAIGSKIKVHFKDGVVEDKVPPWMWGTYCEETDIKEEE